MRINSIAAVYIKAKNNFTKNLNFKSTKAEAFDTNNDSIIDNQALNNQAYKKLVRAHKLANEAEQIREKAYKNVDEVMEIFEEGRKIGFENLKQYKGRDIEVAFKDNTPVAIAEKIDGKIVRRATFSEFLGRDFFVSEIIINPSLNNNKKLPPYSQGLFGNSWSCKEYYSFDVLRGGKLIRYGKNYRISAFGNETSNEVFKYDIRDLNRLGRYSKNYKTTYLAQASDEEIDFDSKQDVIVCKKDAVKTRKTAKSSECFVLAKGYNIYYKNYTLKENKFSCDKKINF